jgi:hypothetical protein
MSDVDALREYAKFRAAGAFISNVGSATDFHLVQVPVAEGGTWRAFEEPYRLLLRTPQTAKDVSSIGGPDTVDLASEQGDLSLGASAALDELRTPEGQMRRQIRSVRVGPRLVYRERLARRLEFLLGAIEEEEEAWSDDSPESLRRMMLFLQSMPTLRYPSVTVTPSATFRAQWTADPNKHFAVDFLPNGEVRFVVFCPDPRHPNRVERVSGITSWENLTHAVKPYEVLRWAADAGT